MSKSKGFYERIPCSVCDETGKHEVIIRGDRCNVDCSECKGKGYRLKKKK